MCPRGEDLLQSWKQPWMKRVSTWSLFHVCRPRAAVAFVQCAQVLIHGSHFLVIYVDDLLAFFSRHEAPILACLCLMLAAAGQWLWEGIPVSWGKLQLADSLRFIGWEICLTSHPVAVLPDDRRAALLAALQPRRVPGAGFNRKDLRTLVGRLRWFTAGFRWLRPWLVMWLEAMGKPKMRLLCARAPSPMSRLGGASVQREDLDQASSRMLLSASLGGWWIAPGATLHPRNIREVSILIRRLDYPDGFLKSSLDKAHPDLQSLIAVAPRWKGRAWLAGFATRV